MESVADRIEALIAARGLRPGDRLPSERQLAVELGVSRPTLREAIQQLASRSLLISRHGGGTFVTAPADPDPLRTALLPLAALVRSETSYWRDVMEIRKLIEGETAYFAALRADETDKTRLAEAYQAVLSAPADAPDAQARLDAAFHMAICHAAHNAVLQQVMAGLFGLLEASISQSLRQLYHLPGIPRRTQRSAPRDPECRRRRPSRSRAQSRRTSSRFRRVSPAADRGRCPTPAPGGTRTTTHRSGVNARHDHFFAAGFP